MASSSLKDYTSLDHCVSGPGITPDLLTSTDSIYPGCHCTETCSSDSDIPCSCSIAYTTDRCLLDAYLTESSPPIFECNANCSCNVSCFNRTSQQYSYHPELDLFHTCSKGMGVRTLNFIPNGSYLGEYVGELLSTSQAMKRLGQLQPADSCYIVQYKEHLSNGNTLVTNIDATQKGNLLRFINHSCSPNLMMVAVRSNSILPRLCLFACRDILSQEEICFSYFGRKGNGISSVDTGTKQCFCDSEECIGYLPLMQ